MIRTVQNQSRYFQDTFEIRDKCGFNLLSSTKNVGDFFGARETVYGCKPEVSQTLVGTAALVDPIFKVEIKVIAHL